MYIAVALSSEDKTLNIHQKVFIYVYLQFKSGYIRKLFGFDISENPFKVQQSIKQYRSHRTSNKASEQTHQQTSLTKLHNVGNKNNNKSRAKLKILSHTDLTCFGLQIKVTRLTLLFPVTGLTTGCVRKKCYLQKINY